MRPAGALEASPDVERGGVRRSRRFRLRTAAAKRFKKVENATAVIWKTLLVAEQSFGRLEAPERLPEVAEGVVFVDGVRENRGNEKAAA